MKYSGVAWIGDIPSDWGLIPTKRVFTGHKDIAGDRWETMNRLALTLNGVVQRSKEDVDGLQPEKFDTYQVLRKNELVFKLIDLQNISTSRVGLSPYDGIVSPAYLVLSNGCEDNRFYYHWFFSMYLNCVFNNMGDNGVRSNLNMKDLLNIPLPNLCENQRTKIADYIDEKCSEIDSLISLQNDMIAKLQEYKQSVITEAVTQGLNPNIPMKNTGVSWLGRIPNHWNIIPFKATFKTRKGLNITKEDLTESGIPVISYGQIHAKFNTGTGVSEKLFRYVPEDYLTSNPECLASKYDSFFADTSEDLEGAGNVAFIDTDDRIFAGYHTIIASPQKSAESKYFAYLFKTDAWRTQLRSIVYGVKVLSITQRILNGTEILIPSIEEQHQIADFLDRKCSEIDSLIDIKKQKIESLKEYKKSLIYECVTGKKEIA